MLRANIPVRALRDNLNHLTLLEIKDFDTLGEARRFMYFTKCFRVGRVAEKSDLNVGDILKRVQILEDNITPVKTDMIFGFPAF